MRFDNRIVPKGSGATHSINVAPGPQIWALPGGIESPGLMSNTSGKGQKFAHNVGASHIRTGKQQKRCGGEAKVYAQAQGVVTCRSAVVAMLEKAYGIGRDGGFL